VSKTTFLKVSKTTMQGALSLVFVLFIAGTTHSAFAIQCGDIITTDTKLTANLGPCPGDGLVVSGAEVTLDFNGHSITGSGSGNGLRFDGLEVATIKGPGTIAKFGTGIATGGGAGATLVYDLVLRGNQTGLWIGPNVAGSFRVLNNVIEANNSSGYGVFINVGTSAYIYQNSISGYSVGVYANTESAATVDENLVTLNQTGIWARYPDRSCSTIRGNRVLLNKGNGIQTGINYNLVAPDFPGAPPTCLRGIGADIEDNTVTLNGGSGIVIQGGAESSQFVQDNTVSANKLYGIAVFGTAVDVGGTVQSVGNYTIHNHTDLFWDGVGTTNCWQQNIFSTSSPPVLPGC
jgi:hypothetical protein